MCGIFGAIQSGGGYFGESDYHRFTKLTDAVSHRGPDTFDYVALDLQNGRLGTPAKFDAFLGHRRLSILDLSDAGRQPMRGDGDVWITFNGEIYNYLELKNDLKDRYNFRNNTDTEVILATYQTFGTEGFSQFNGDWAFAIADLPRRWIVLSRDRFSIKPFYYCQQNDAIYFGSEIKQLLPLMNSVQLNRDTIMVYLNQGILDSTNETFFEGVRRLPAKSFATFEAGQRGLLFQTYWQYTKPSSELDLDEAVEAFRELLIDSVRIRLRSDVKVGSLVSGGLDSSSLAVIANILQPNQVKTYSVVPLDPAYSEVAFVDALIRQTSIPNRKLYLDLSRVIDVMEKTITANDEPPAGFSVLAHYAMMEKIRFETDLTVVLSGQGGDETMMGYLKYFFFYLDTLLRRGSLLRLGREMFFSLINRTGLSQLNLSEAARYRPTTRSVVRPFLRTPCPIAPIFEYQTLRERQIADIDLYSVPNLTHYEDRNAGAFGLEIRLPFLDHRLVDFCLGLRDDLKLRHGWSKYILRYSLPEVPLTNRWRRDKKGFSLPEAVWLKSELSDFIKNIFRKSLLAEMEIIDTKDFLAYFQEFQRGSQLIWYTDISRTLMAEVWCRMHFSRPALSEMAGAGSEAAAGEAVAKW
jgi:asparagine synthase (glutamine-hydrolysing)